MQSTAVTATATTQLLSFTTAGARANVVAGELAWPSGVSVTAVTPLEGVITYWITPPRVTGDGQTVVFAGMTPGGFITEQSPLFSVTLEGEVRDSVPQVTKFVLLAHDGKGTPLATSRTVLTAPVSTGGVAASNVDQHAPVFSLLAVVREPDLFDGAPTLIFAAHDDHSGIREVSVARYTDGAFVPISSPWQIPVSWYHDSLLVRATDVAGRHTTVTLPPVSPGAIPGIVFTILLGVLGMVCGYLCYRYYSVYRNRERLRQR